MVTTTSLIGVMKVGTIVLRVDIESTYLAFWANVLITTQPMLPEVTTMHTNLPIRILAQAVSADYYTTFKLAVTKARNRLT